MWHRIACPSRGILWSEVSHDDFSQILQIIRTHRTNGPKTSTTTTRDVDKVLWIQLWKAMHDYVSPYEADRELYDVNPAGKGFIMIHPLLYQALLSELGTGNVNTGFHKIGFGVDVQGECVYLRRGGEGGVTGSSRSRRMSTSNNSISVSGGGSNSPVQYPPPVMVPPSLSIGVTTSSQRSVSFEIATAQGGAGVVGSGANPADVSMEDDGMDEASNAAVGGGESTTPTTTTNTRDLEAQIRDLTKQLRALKSKSESTEPQILSQSLVASSQGNSVIPIQVSSLEPDFMPYCISLSMTTERRIIPCTILDHQFLVFVAPPHPVGSVSVTIMCGPGPVLRKYCKSVWLEYRADGVPPAPTPPAAVCVRSLTPTQQPTSKLTHHEVNQISSFTHIQRPIQSVQDTSEAPETKSNYTSDVGDVDPDYHDSQCSDDGDASVSAVQAAHDETNSTSTAPLTRDMLELLTRAQNFFLQPVSREPYTVSLTGGVDGHQASTSQVIMDDLTSCDDQVSYCATVNSVVPPSVAPASPKEKSCIE